MTRDHDRARLSRIKRDLGPDFDRYEFELCEPGVEPSVQEEIERGGGWHLGGYKGLRHWVRNKPPKLLMTRDEAFDRARTALLTDWRTRHPEWMWGKQSDSSVHDMLSVIEGLGLIKFDEPKAPEAIEVLITAIGAIDADIAITKLKQAGFKIVRAP